MREADPSGETDRRVVHGVEPDTVLVRLLRAAREHLGVEAAFIGELTDGTRVIRFIDQADGLSLLEVDQVDADGDSYCALVVDRRVPSLLTDPRDHPLTAALPATEAVPVGTHVSVPIRFSDGTVYGTFCAFSTDVHNEIGEQHLAAIRLMADLAAQHLEHVVNEARDQRARRRRIEQVLDVEAGMTMVFQPLCRLSDSRILAVEALARFAGSSDGPQWFFEEATRLGLGRELELFAVDLALRDLARLPPDVQLQVNVSASTLVEPRFLALVAATPPGRLVVEVTEHAAATDYPALVAVRDELGRSGARLSIDDVGTGWSGLHRILEVEPHQLKLDAEVIRNLDQRPNRQDLVAALVEFARRSGAEVVAEGIETDSELLALRRLGVPVGQGYHLARPAPIAEIDFDRPLIVDLESSGRADTQP